MDGWLRKSVFGLTMGAIGFCIAMMVGHFLVDNRVQWETLATGVMAIGAAAWTVSAALRADANQGERHRQLVRLSLRADALRAQKAGASGELLYIYTAFPITLDGGLRQAMLDFKSWCEEVLKVLTSPDLRSAIDLFDATLYGDYQLLVETLTEACRTAAVEAD